MKPRIARRNKSKREVRPQRRRSPARWIWAGAGVAAIGVVLIALAETPAPSASCDGAEVLARAASLIEDARADRDARAWRPAVSKSTEAFDLVQAHCERAHRCAANPREFDRILAEARDLQRASERFAGDEMDAARRELARTRDAASPDLVADALSRAEAHVNSAVEAGSNDPDVARIQERIRSVRVDLIAAREAAARTDEQAILKAYADGVVRIERRSEDGVHVGTGFLIDRLGTILTNRHVVGDAESVDVRAIGTHRLTAKVHHVAANPRIDLAILTVDPRWLPNGAAALPLADSDVDVGSVAALGFPGGVERLRADFGSLTEPVGAYRGISVDVGEGNSGGPVIDLERGVVAGMTTFKSIGQAAGFALSIRAIRAELRQAGFDLPAGEPFATIRSADERR